MHWSLHKNPVRSDSRIVQNGRGSSRDEPGFAGPGGVGVHTTEYNLSSNERTVEQGPTVLYRRRDLDTIRDALDARCSAPGGPKEVYERYVEDNNLTRGPEGVYTRPSDKPGFGWDFVAV